ncbi:MAG: glycosyltransferase [Clostridia bacterium]|nr:glycosyltransferase [Clostridia bacterium]
MIDDPRVSACIVLYKTSSIVLDAVRSLTNSTERVQLYIVDNSAELTIQRLIENLDPSTVFYPQATNLGYGKGHNVVIPHLKSEYHLIMTPDITFAPDLISRMVDYMDAHPDIVILSPRVFFPDGNEQHLPHRRPTVRYLLGGPLEKYGKPFTTWRDEYTMKNEDITVPIDVEFATGCFMMVRTHALYQMRGFDERYFLYQEDSDLTLKALQYGHVVYHPDMHVTHAWNREDARSLKLRWVHIVSTAKFFWKWGIQW